MLNFIKHCFELNGSFISDNGSKKKCDNRRSRLMTLENCEERVLLTVSPLQADLPEVQPIEYSTIDYGPQTAETTPDALVVNLNAPEEPQSAAPAPISAAPIIPEPVAQPAAADNGTETLVMNAATTYAKGQKITSLSNGLQIVSAADDSTYDSASETFTGKWIVYEYATSEYTMNLTSDTEVLYAGSDNTGTYGTKIKYGDTTGNTGETISKISFKTAVTGDTLTASSGTNSISAIANTNDSTYHILQVKTRCTAVSSGTLTLNGKGKCTVTGLNTYMFIYVTTGAANISNLTIQDCRANSYGGITTDRGPAISLGYSNNLASSSTITNCNLYNNWTRDSGPAINAYMKSGNTLTITGGEFCNNTSGNNAGCIYVNGALTIMGNSASDRVLFEHNIAGVNINQDKKYNDNMVLVDDTAAENSEWVSSGAIFVEGGTITLKNANFIDNASNVIVTNDSDKQPSTAGAGAIYVSNGKLVVNDNVQFTGNNAYNSGYTDQANNNCGGAIRADSDVYINGTNVVFNENEAYDGGAIYCNSGKNIYVIRGSAVTFTNNLAVGNGGAIYCNGTMSVGCTTSLTDVGTIPAEGTSTTITINGEEHTLTALDLQGQGSYYGLLQVGDQVLNGDGTYTAMTATTISQTNPFYCVLRKAGDIVSGHTLTESDISPIGIYKALGYTTVDETVSGNKAGKNGGAIYCTGSITATDTSFDIQNNQALTGAGGAIFCSGTFSNSLSTSVTDDITFTASNNTAKTTGGAICISGSGTFSVNVNNNIVISSNSAANGGAIYSASGAVMLTSTAGTLTASNNSATTSGGGIYTDSANVTITANGTGASTISSNTAATNGGLVFSNSGSVSISVGGALTASDNKATSGSGGLIYGKATISATGDITMSGNTATAGNGGLIYSSSGAVSITSTGGSMLISGSQATNGGAVYNAGTDAVTLSASSGKMTLANNQATAGSGGVVHNQSSGTVTITASTTAGNESTIYSNTASASGGVFNLADGTLTLTGLFNLYTNTAGTNGGAISCAGDITVASGSALTFGKDEQYHAVTAADLAQAGAYYLSGITAGTNVLTGNVAQAGNGGAVYCSDKMTVNGDLTARFNQAISTTTDTTSANGNGGAVYCTGLMTVSGNLTATNNTAFYSGGALYCNNAFTVSGSMTVTDNTASDGIVYNPDDLTANKNRGGGIYLNGLITLGTSTTLNNNSADTGYGENLYLGASGEFNCGLTTMNNVSGESGSQINVALTGAADYVTISTGLVKMERTVSGVAELGRINIGSSFSGTLTLDVDGGANIIELQSTPSSGSKLTLKTGSECTLIVNPAGTTFTYSKVTTDTGANVKLDLMVGSAIDAQGLLGYWNGTAVSGVNYTSIISNLQSDSTRVAQLQTLATYGVSQFLKYTDSATKNSWAEVSNLADTQVDYQIQGMNFNGKFGDFSCISSTTAAIVGAVTVSDLGSDTTGGSVEVLLYSNSATASITGTGISYTNTNGNGTYGVTLGSNGTTITSTEKYTSDNSTFFSDTTISALETAISNAISTKPNILFAPTVNSLACDTNADRIEIASGKTVNLSGYGHGIPVTMDCSALTSVSDSNDAFISNAGTLTLEKITITGANAVGSETIDKGSAIYNTGTLTIDGGSIAVIDSCTATGAANGVIYSNGGTVSLAGVKFTNITGKPLYFRDTNVTIEAGVDATVTGAGGSLTVKGTSGDDFFELTGDAVKVNEGDSDVERVSLIMLNSFTGSVTLNGDAGNDIFWRSAGSNTLTVNPGSGNDVIIGSAVTYENTSLMGVDFVANSMTDATKQSLSDFSAFWQTPVGTITADGGKEVVLAAQTTGFAFTENSRSYTVEQTTFGTPKVYSNGTAVSAIDNNGAVSVSTITNTALTNNATVLDGNIEFDEAIAYAKAYNSANNLTTGLSAFNTVEVEEDLSGTINLNYYTGTFYTFANASTSARAINLDGNVITFNAEAFSTADKSVFIISAGSATKFAKFTLDNIHTGVTGIAINNTSAATTIDTVSITKNASATTAYSIGTDTYYVGANTIENLAGAVGINLTEGNVYIADTAETGSLTITNATGATGIKMAAGTGLNVGNVTKAGTLTITNNSGAGIEMTGASGSAATVNVVSGSTATINNNGTTVYGVKMNNYGTITGVVSDSTTSNFKIVGKDAAANGTGIDVSGSNNTITGVEITSSNVGVNIGASANANKVSGSIIGATTTGSSYNNTTNLPSNTFDNTAGIIVQGTGNYIYSNNVYNNWLFDVYTKWNNYIGVATQGEADSVVTNVNGNLSDLIVDATGIISGATFTSVKSDNAYVVRNTASDNTTTDYRYKWTSGIASFTLYCGDGNDIVNLSALAVNSIVYGGAGNDVIIGGSGNDYLNGGDGSDLLIGGGYDDGTNAKGSVSTATDYWMKTWGENANRDNAVKLYADGTITRAMLGADNSDTLVANSGSGTDGFDVAFIQTETTTAPTTTGFTGNDLVVRKYDNYDMYTSIIVTNDGDTTSGTDNKITLREAIALAKLPINGTVTLPIANTILFNVDSVTLADTANNSLAVDFAGLTIDGNDRYNIVTGAKTTKTDMVTVTATTTTNKYGVFSVTGGTTANPVVFKNLAITKGNTTNGGGINNAGTLDLNNVAIYSNTTTGNGGGIYNTGTITDSGAVYIGVQSDGTTAGANSAANGGGIYNNGGTITFDHTTTLISNNTATSDGGGVYNASGSMTLSTATISGNSAITSGTTPTSGNEGGGVYVAGGTFTLQGTVSIISNKAYDGAGVYVNGGAFTNVSADATPTYGKVTIGGADGNGNVASGNGGGIYVANGGTVTLNEGNANADVLISYNEAADGAGLYVAANGTATLTGNSDTDMVEISNNWASSEGAGIYNASAVLTLNKVALNANVAAAGTRETTPASGNVGGGLYNSATVTGTVKNLVVTNNKAYDGGGVYNKSGSLTLSDVTISGDGTTTAEAVKGGGIYVEAGTVYAQGTTTGVKIIDLNATDGAGVYVAGGAFTNVKTDGANTTYGKVTIGENGKANAATNNGGGIYVANGGTVTLNKGNANADVLISYNEAADGAGLYVAANGTATLTGSSTSDMVEISNNWASSEGAGIYNASTNLAFDKVSLNANVAATGTRATTPAAGNVGGGLYNSAAVTREQMKNLIVTGNKAYDGAGIWTNADLTLNSSSVGPTSYGTGSNVATNFGGGVYVTDATLTLASSTVQNNQAQVVGGGVYLTKATLDGGNAANSSIANNQAVSGTTYQNGGNVYTTDMNTIKDVTITGNGTQQLAVNGGGVYVKDGTTTVQGTVVVTKNNATDGAGVYVAGGEFTNVSADATPTYGKVTIGGADGNGNVASGNGGGIYQAGGTVTLTENAAASAVEISYNSAQNGAGVYVETGATKFDLSGKDTNNQASVNHNTASVSGGGIYNAAQAFNLNYVAIDNNMAKGTSYANTNLGGGLYNSANVTTAIESVVITNNKAYDGAGVYNTSTGTMTLSNVSIGQDKATTPVAGANVASHDGGGIYNDGALTLDGTNYINNNKATNAGGGIFQTGNEITLGGNDYVSSNTAANGAGVYIDGNSKVNLQNGTTSTITGNTASLSGGGFYVAANGTLEVTTAVVSGNTANGTVAVNLNRGGGGIYNLGAVTVATSLTMESNKATNGFGGAIYNGGAGTIAGGNLVIGKASDTAYAAANNAVNGGGIYQNSSAALTLDKNDKIYYNTATNGAGVYVNTTLSFSNEGAANVTGNKATTSGGGFYVSSTGTLNLTDTGNTLIQSNYAANGGGMYLDGTLTKVETAKLTFEQNNYNWSEMTNNGGGLYIAANAKYGKTDGTPGFQINANDKGTLLFSKNGTDDQTFGGAIYVGTGATLYFATDYIFGNNGANTNGVYTTLVAHNDYANFGTGAAIYSVGTVTNAVVVYTNSVNNNTTGNYNAGSAETTDVTQKQSTKTFSLFVTGQSGDGAIGVGGGTVTLSNVKIYNNASGGVIVEGGLMKLDNGTEIGVDQSSSATTSYSNALYNTAFGLSSTNTTQAYGAKVTGGTLFVAEADSVAYYKNEWKDSTDTNKGRYNDYQVKDSVKISGNNGYGVEVTDGAAYINDARIEANTGTGFSVTGGTVGVYNTLIADNTTDASVTGGTATFNNTTIAKVSILTGATLSNTINGPTLNGKNVNFVTDVLGNKYTLGAKSAAYNTGDNAQVLAFKSDGTTELRTYETGSDIAGHHRVLYQNVDYGCFEQPIYWVTDQDSLEDIKTAVENVETIDNGGKVSFDSSCEGKTFSWEDDSKAGTICFNKSTIVDGRKVDGSKYYWQNITLDAENLSGLFGVDVENVEVSIYGLTLKNGNGKDQSGTGGAICSPAPGVTLRLYSVSCINCTASQMGGAIYSARGAKLEITTPKMENGYLQSLFSGNSAGTGGAIYIDSLDDYNLVHDPGDTNNFTLSGVKFYGTGAVETTDIFDSTKSAGKVEQYINKNLAEYSIRFVNNEAGRYGGAVNVEATNIAEMEKVSFLANKAGYKNGTNAATGGAVMTNASMALTGVDFVSNATLYNGGALAVGTGGDVTLKNVLFGANKSDSNYGGALYADHGGKIKTEASTTVAGVVLVQDDTQTKTLGGYTLELLKNSAYIGGAVSNSGGTITLDSIYAAYNTASYGGAISSIAGAITVTSNATPSLFEHNTAANGGAICSNGGAVSVTKATLSNNSAEIGGAASSVTGSVTLTNATMTGNKATTYGGAVASNGGTMTVTGGTIGGDSEDVKNSAEFGGGAAAFGGTLKLANVSIKNNSATNGGGVAVITGAFSITGAATVTANTATEHGGGLYLKTTATLDATTKALFTGNTSGNPEDEDIYVHNRPDENVPGTSASATDLAAEPVAAEPLSVEASASPVEDFFANFKDVLDLED